ncbi:MAG: LytTR family DNA-binding domain-containing protein [Caldimicrobium sp.]|nr:LytTR family DNA-binding domain-containing protein [Caldimicrobium sp.]MCX7874234.1 LytTR family DNA-binding domain-containing protein [Caldimicrobium sp.]MDW8094763.1 LytTR family DNA-binding domain-containing protein [Caldimicrobium sp.]
MFEEVLVVDDEPIALERLERMLKALGVKKVYKFDNAYQAKVFLKQQPEIKLVFLDIRMPGKSGLELAKEIAEERTDLVIVIQTAYEDYALEGFRVGAIDYLVKPFTLEELCKALERAKRYLGELESEYLQVKTTDEVKKLVSIGDIYYIKADLKHTLIRTINGFFFCDLSIGALQEKLRKKGFLRVHRSYLVNLSKVTRLEEVAYGKICLHFSSSIEPIITSKGGAALLRKEVKRKKQ